MKRPMAVDEFGERQWEQPALIPRPKPEVPARPARPEEIPSAASKLAKLAEEHGWAVRVTYARGTRPGRKPKVVDSIAVRLWREPGRRAVACWTDGKRSSWISDQGWPPGNTASADEFKAWITS